jgi:1-acyl-sn-glycerol-3-phosphate acyltransferase
MSLGYLWALLVKDPIILVSTALMGSLSVLTSTFSQQLPDRIAHLWARWLLWVAGARVRVSGLDHIDAHRSYVFVGNHQSLFDTPVVLAHLPVRFRFLVNDRYVRKPFLGAHLRRSGHFSVVIGDVRASLRAMSAAARAIRERGISILVFPEGSRAVGDQMTEFKEGAAYIALKAGVPVVPFALRGTREVLPKGSLYVKGGPVELVFGEPVSTDRRLVRDRTEFNRLLFQAVANLRADIDARPQTRRQAVS